MIVDGKNWGWWSPVMWNGCWWSDSAGQKTGNEHGWGLAVSPWVFCKYFHLSEIGWLRRAVTIATQGWSAGKFIGWRIIPELFLDLLMLAGWCSLLVGWWGWRQRREMAWNKFNHFILIQDVGRHHQSVIYVVLLWVSPNQSLLAISRPIFGLPSYYNTTMSETAWLLHVTINDYYNYTPAN